MTEVKRPCETCEHYKYDWRGGFYSCSVWKCDKEEKKDERTIRGTGNSDPVQQD